MEKGKKEWNMDLFYNLCQMQGGQFMLSDAFLAFMERITVDSQAERLIKR